MIKVGIIGATGYAGQELVRLLEGHGNAEVKWFGSRSYIDVYKRQALFAAEIYRMYVKYAESQNWKTEMMSLNENGIGGFKEVTFMINGKGAYSRLKYESGVHRVQRVPETESGGRIHTSTITVAIMPEAEEIDFELDLNDCKFDVFRASGNGRCV